MRWLLGIVIVLGVAWAGYWFAGSVAIRRGVEQALADAAAGGKTAEADVSVAGFPNRWDLTLSGLRLGDPVSGARLDAPFLQVFAMTWKPWHVIAAAPPDLALTVQGQVISLGSDGLKASLRARPALDLPLAEVRLSGQSVAVQSDQGWLLTLGEFTIGLREEPQAGAAAYEFGFDLAPFGPDPAFLATLKAVSLPGLPAPEFPETVDVLSGTLHLGLTAPLNRHASEVPPQVNRIEIGTLTAEWGALKATATGRIEVDADGYAAGRIAIDITNWDRLPALLVASGAVKPEIAPTIAGGMKALAAQSPDPAVLSLPLVMNGGKMSLGPFPLGEAPRLRPPSG